MSNKFYKPKNEYGELLTTQNALNSETKARKEQDEIINNRLTLEAALIRSEFASADSELKNELELKIDNADNEIKDSIEALDKKLDGVDNKLDTKIDTFKTISVIFVENSSLDDYFQTVIQDKKMTLDELKVELGRSIYIIKGKDDENTWEEYICKNPDFLSENGKPEMIRLGAVDSIFARLEDTDFCMGSVSLAHNLYIKSEEDYKWNKYFDRMMDGEHLDAPIPGKAVAPCALRAFVKADEKLEAENKAVELKLVNITDNLQSQITEIKNELNGNSEATDYEGSRIDKIEEAIGILGCPSCGKDNCEHDSAKGKCTIYCRLNDIEGDIVELDNNINDVAGSLQEEIERATDAETTLQSEINAEKSRATKAETVLQANIDAENLRAVAAETDLQVKIDAEIERATKAETNLQTDLNAEKARAANAEVELQSKINAEERRATTAETNLQIEIDKINEEIGTHDSSSTKTIWETIDDNFVENKKYTDDKFEVATECIFQNANDISSLTSLVGVKGSTSTDTVWGAIGESNSKILSLENSLGEKAANETKKAWAYIYDHENRLITAEDTIEANTNQISDIITNKIGSSSKGSTDTVWKAIETSEANISNLAEIKADKTTVEAITAEITAEIGKPGNHRDDNTLWGEINGTKDDITRIDNTIAHIQNEVIGSTEDASDGNTLHSKIKFLRDTKADTTYVDTVVSVKADTTYVNDQILTVNGVIDTKADKTYVENELGKKADKTYVDSQITAVNGVVATKASLIYVDEQIKAVTDVIGENKTDEATIWSAISNLKSKANTADATIAEHSAQITSNASEIRDIKSKIGESNTSINRTVWQAIEANAAEISQNVANIAKVKIDADKVDDLSENLDKLTTDFNSLKANVGTSEDSIENGKTLWSATNKNTAEIANNAKNIAKNIEDINNNKLDIAGHEASISVINSKIQDLTEDIKGIDTNKGDIADIKSAIGTSEDGIENGKTVWSKVNANTHAINALTPRVTSLETKTSNMASTDYVDTTVANAISDSVEDINNTIAESMAQTKVEVKDYANSLRVGQPGIAVINCVLTSPTANADGTYGGTKRVHVIDILKGLDSSLFNNLADVNVAVTSTRYIANDDTPGEQITPDIRYYAGTSDDGTNARYFEVTFEDLKVEPKYLIMTITYWEQDKIILV